MSQAHGGGARRPWGGMARILGLDGGNYVRVTDLARQARKRCRRSRTMARRRRVLVLRR